MFVHSICLSRNTVTNVYVQNVYISKNWGHCHWISMKKTQNLFIFIFVSVFVVAVLPLIIWLNVKKKFFFQDLEISLQSNKRYIVHHITFNCSLAMATTTKALVLRTTRENGCSLNSNSTIKQALRPLLINFYIRRHFYMFINYKIYLMWTAYLKERLDDWW